MAACGGSATSSPPGAPATATGADCEPATLVLVGGDVRTMVPAQPAATAVAIRDGRIAAVGDDAAVAALVGDDTRVVELAGRTVAPGLIDAHAHLYGLGTALESVSLRGLDSAEKAAAAVADAARGRPAGDWITGRGWDQNLWNSKEFPNKATLDAAVPAHPVAVRRVDGHALWVNSKALALAGVTRATKDPADGKIMRDARGEPTGVFLDGAMGLIEGEIPEPGRAERERRIVRAAREAVSHGLTGVHEMGIGDDTLAVYRELEARGELPLRIYAFLSYGPDTQRMMSSRAPQPGDGDDRLVVRGVKIYADGALGSRGAALLAPYDDDAGNTGLLLTAPEEIADAAAVAAAHGWQLGVHAIGDRGNRGVLDAFERAIAAHPEADLRFRIEHAQVLAAEDIPRFAKLGVIASMQPTHATSDMPWAEARVGAERARGAYAWRSLLDSGAHVAAGSDFPVEQVPPLLGLYAAVTRQDPAGQPPGGWHPDQRMTLDEALRAFTAGAAYAQFAEGFLGALRPGALADVTVFDRTLAPDATLLETGVDLTVVGGAAVHASPWAAAQMETPGRRPATCR